MIWPHPSRRRLTRFAESPDDWKVQVHVEQCERCIAIVEGALPGPDLALGDILRTMLSAPASLEDELVTRAEELRSRRAILEVLGGFATLPWETLRVMIQERRPDDG